MRQLSGFQDVVDLIGEANSLRLVRQHGGTSLVVPARYDTNNPDGLCAQLSALIGSEAAESLVFTYASLTLSVPRLAAHQRRQRDASMQHQFDEMTGAGMSAREAVRRLARAFSIVESTVWRALKRPTAAEAFKPIHPNQD